MVKWLTIRNRLRRVSVAFQSNPVSTSAGLATAILSGGSPGLIALGALGAVAHVGDDFLERKLSSNEQARVKRVISQASQIYSEYRDLGMEVRDDDFFDSDVDGRSSYDETIEASLSVAKDSFEENKLPYIAHFLAILPLRPELDATAANRVLALANDLSWAQYVVLAAIGQKEKVRLPSSEQVANSLTWSTWSLNDQIFSMFLTNLVTSPYKFGDPNYAGTMDTRLEHLVLGSGGQLLYQSLGLSRISALTITSFFNRVISPP